MAKRQGGNVLNFIAWFTGVVVSLVVGNAMIQSVLKLPKWLGGGDTIGVVMTAGDWVAIAIGWIVVITTLVGAVMALLKK